MWINSIIFTSCTIAGHNKRVDDINTVVKTETVNLLNNNQSSVALSAREGYCTPVLTTGFVTEFRNSRARRPKRLVTVRLGLEITC